MHKRLLLIAFLIPVSFILFFRLTSSYNFNTDYTRDLYRVLNISKGHPTLIGPPLSIGIFSAPYYYYFILPALLLSGVNPNAFLIYNAVLFFCGVTVLGLIISRKWGILPLYGLVLSPFFLNAGRGASNAYLYLPFLIIVLYVIFFGKLYKKIHYLFLGITTALILNFHPVSLFAVFPVSLYLFVKLQNKRYFLYFLVPILLSLTPLIFFEAKHGFVITKGLLSGNYKNFVTNTVPRDILTNFSFVTTRFTWLLGIHPIIYFLSLFLIIRKIGKSSLWWLYYCALFSFLISVLLLRFQFESHYLFPACTLIVFTTVMALTQLNSKRLNIIWLIILISSFSLGMYSHSTRTVGKYAVAVDYLIKNKLISSNDKFNVIGIIDSSNRVVNGNEYRFFLTRSGFNPLSETDYAKSGKLIVFSEDRNYPLSRLHTWETEQFGQKYLASAHEYDSGDILIYVADK
jgi:hypothetical protein